MLGYLCAYYRYYYPIEFCTAFLNCSKSDEDIYNGTMLAQQKGFKIEQPKFRKAGDEWRFDKKSGTIYKSLKSIKDIGDKTGSNLLTLKDFTGDFVDLLVAIRENKLAKKNELDILIKLNFFSEFGDINRLLYTYNIFQQLYSANGWKKNLQKKKLEEIVANNCCAQQINPETFAIEPYTEEYTNKKGEIKTRTIKYSESDTQYNNIRMVDFLTFLYDNYDGAAATVFQKMQWENELLGYIATTDPSLDWRYCIVTKVDTKFSPVVDLYCMKNGKNNTMKIKKSRWKDKTIKTIWKDLPLQVGDLIYIKNCRQEFKNKKIDDRWVKTDQKEWLLVEYNLVQRQEQTGKN